MSELKPCPFCSSSDVSEKINLASGLYIHCNYCGARNDENYTGDNRHITRWNTRNPSIDDIVAAVESLIIRYKREGFDTRDLATYNQGIFEAIVAIRAMDK